MRRPDDGGSGLRALLLSALLAAGACGTVALVLGVDDAPTTGAHGARAPGSYGAATAPGSRTMPDRVPTRPAPAPAAGVELPDAPPPRRTVEPALVARMRAAHDPALRTEASTSGIETRPDREAHAGRHVHLAQALGHAPDGARARWLTGWLEATLAANRTALAAGRDPAAFNATAAARRAELVRALGLHGAEEIARRVPLHVLREDGSLQRVDARGRPLVTGDGPDCEDS